MHLPWNGLAVCANNGTFCSKECEQFTPNATTDMDLKTQYRMKAVNVEQN